MKENLGKCRSCGANILWVKLRSGKAHPCDPEIVSAADCEEGDRLINEYGDITTVTWKQKGEGYISHFSTCPDADKWRKSSERQSNNQVGRKNEN